MLPDWLLVGPMPFAVMGGLAGFVLWLAAALITMVALKDTFRLLRRGLAMAGRVERAQVESDGLASLHIERVGRAGSASAVRRAVVVLDRSVRSEGRVGLVRLSDGRAVQVDGAACEIWVERKHPPHAKFEEAFALASKIKGWVHSFDQRLGKGDPLFVVGNLQSKNHDHHLAPLSDGAMVLSAFDPRPFIWVRLLLSVITVVGLLTVPAVATWLVVENDPASWQAIAGGVIGLVYFLLAQPLGVALRQFVALPHTGLQNHVWAAPVVSSDSRAALASV